MNTSLPASLPTEDRDKRTTRFFASLRRRIGTLLVVLCISTFAVLAVAEEPSPEPGTAPHPSGADVSQVEPTGGADVQADTVPELPAQWATVNRDTFLHETPSPDAGKSKLVRNSVVLLEQTDRFGWSFVWTVEKTKGWTPRFHLSDGKGERPAELIIAWSPPAEDGDGEGEDEADLEGAEAEPPPVLEPMTDQQMSERWELLTRERAALADFAQGRISERFQTADLFTLNLLEQESVNNRITQLQRRVEDKLRLVAFLEKLAAKGEASAQAIVETPFGEVIQESAPVSSETPATSQTPGADPSKKSVAASEKDAPVSPTETSHSPKDAVPATPEAEPSPAAASLPGRTSSSEEPAEKPTEGAVSPQVPTEKPPRFVPSRLELEKAELDALDLRLAFLGKPLEQRKAILDAEIERKRAAEQKIRAEAEQRKAEAEARAAEEARRQALERAEQARSAAERALALELARLEGVKNEIAEFRKQLSIGRQEASLRRSRNMNRINEVTAQVASLAEGSDEAAKLYDELVTELTEIRKRISDQLDAFGGTAKAPRFVGELQKLQAMTDEQQKEKRTLEESADAVSEDADRLDADSRELALEDLRATVDLETGLNDARLSLLQRLSETHRGELLGFGPRGLAQFGREVVHFSLMLRWMEFGGERLLIDKVSQLKDPYQALDVLGKLTMLLLLVAGYFFVRRRLGRFVEIPDTPPRRTGSFSVKPDLSRRLRETLQPIYRDVLFLVLTLLWPLFLNVHAERSAGTLLYKLLLLVALYRLSLSVGFRALLWMILMNIGQLDAERRSKLERSVRIVSRFVFSIIAMLTVAGFTLGEGYLYHLVSRLAFWGALVIFISLAFWWRKKISSDFVTLWPESSLSRELTAARGRWYELVFTLLALVYLAIFGLFGAFRHVALGFDFVQKLVAYLFRKRLEHEAEARYEAMPSSLEPPEVLKRAFDETEESRPEQRLDHFPKMDAFLRQVESWDAGGRHGSFLVIGKAGVGKTEWLREALRRNQVHSSSYLDLSERLIEPERLTQFLSQGLFPDMPPLDSADDLVARFRQGRRRIVALDNLHMAHLRGPDTLRGWWAFNRLMEQTGDHIFWLVSFGYHPYEFLSWVRKDRDVFRDAVVLQTWDEGLVSELLSKRMNAAGWHADYRALVPGGQSGVYTQARIDLTARDFNRLVWDFTLGSPRSALHYWLKSLVPGSEKTAQVRLFPQPEGNLLERRDETDKFVLASVYWHNRLTVQEAALSLRYPIYACADSLIKMHEMGILRYNNDGWYSVTTAWWPLVTRYLRRKNLIRN